MRAVIQRAKNTRVIVSDEVIGEINYGLVVLIGVTHEDTSEDIEYLVNKIAHLRIFEDQNKKMNLSLLDIGGSILSVSQFTLHADTRKGRRPSFISAANPEYAEEMYGKFNEQIAAMGINVETGEFGAMMDVQFTNAGPVTIIIDSKNK